MREHNKQMKKEDVENIRLELSKNELEVLEHWLYSCEFDRGLYEKDINLIKKIRKQSKTEFGILDSYEWGVKMEDRKVILLKALGSSNRIQYNRERKMKLEE